MPEYRVTWSIDLHAPTAREAAELAEASYINTEGCRVYEVAEWRPLDIASVRATLSDDVEQVDLDR